MCALQRAAHVWDLTMQRHVFAKSVRPQRAYCKTTTYGHSKICSVLLG